MLRDVITYMFQEFLHKFACREYLGSYGSNLDVQVGTYTSLLVQLMHEGSENLHVE